MYPPDQGTTDDSSRKWIIGLAGCGFILFLALLGAVGLGIYFVANQAEEFVDPSPYPEGPPSYPGSGLPNGGGKPTLGGGGGGGGVTGPNSRTFTAAVSRVTGPSASMLQGTTCDLRVERVPNTSAPGGYWCHTIVTCGGRVLYGSATQGFFTCTMTGDPPAVIGGETQTTGVDGDAAFQINSSTGTLSLSDDAAGPVGEYYLEARLGSVI